MQLPETPPLLGVGCLVHPRGARSTLRGGRHMQHITSLGSNGAYLGSACSLHPARPASKARSGRGDGTRMYPIPRDRLAAQYKSRAVSAGRQHPFSGILHQKTSMTLYEKALCLLHPHAPASVLGTLYKYAYTFGPSLDSTLRLHLPPSSTLSSSCTDLLHLLTCRQPLSH